MVTIVSGSQPLASSYPFSYGCEEGRRLIANVGEAVDMAWRETGSWPPETLWLGVACGNPLADGRRGSLTTGRVCPDGPEWRDIEAWGKATRSRTGSHDLQLEA